MRKLFSFLLACTLCIGIVSTTSCKPDIDVKIEKAESLIQKVDDGGTLTNDERAFLKELKKNESIPTGLYKEIDRALGL